LDQPEELVLTSSAFDDGADIPDLYTCRGKNISPPLSWAGAPAGTRSLALILEDPDTPFGTVTHWVLYGIAGDATELAEGVPPGRVLPGGLRQGRNGMFRFGYMGPCPPWGKHRYVLHLFALDAAIDTDRVMNKRRLLRRIEPHILSRARLLGHYARAR
jgi:hypothetical protein